MKLLDFLTINWNCWETNANYNAIEFVVRLKKGLPPPFKFEMKTVATDELGLRLHEAFVSRVPFTITRGPLGGGTYFITEEGGWPVICGVIDSSTGEKKVNPPKIGDRAFFTFQLTGAPGFADLLQQNRR